MTVTVIKTKSVSSASHFSHVASYFESDKALARETEFISKPDHWAAEMKATREAYGHDGAARSGKSALGYHFVIGFLPEDADFNGGKMTAERCMEFARDWIEERYGSAGSPGKFGSYESCWVLHREHCVADGTDRYAVHIFVNRTDLDSGRRLNEGPARRAKVERARAMRAMDEKWGLRQVEKGKRNSKIHARQPTRKEQAMEARGIRSDKRYLREAIRASVKEVRSAGGDHRMRDLARSLEKKGVMMTRGARGGLVFERKSTSRKVSGYKLGRGFSAAGIASGLGIRVGRAMEREAEQGMER